MAEGLFKNGLNQTRGKMQDVSNEGERENEMNSNSILNGK